MAGGGAVALAVARALSAWATDHRAAANAGKLPPIARSMAVDAMGNADWAHSCAFSSLAAYVQAFQRAAAGGHAAAAAAGAAAANRIIELSPADTIDDMRPRISCRCLAKGAAARSRA